MSAVRRRSQTAATKTKTKLAHYRGNPAGTHSMSRNHGWPLCGHREAAPLLRSEFKSRAHLDIARPADAAVPQPELIAAGCAGHVVVEGLSSPLAGTGKGVPVEQVEELGP